MPAATAPKPALTGWPLFVRVARHSFSLEKRNIGPTWMYLAVTALFSTLIAVVLTVMFIGLNSRVRFWSALWETWMISQCIGFAMHGLSGGFMRWALSRGFGQWPAHTRLFAMVAVALVAINFGYGVGFALTGRNFFALVANNPRFALSQIVIASAAILTWFLISRAQTAHLRHEAEQARAEAQTEALKSQAADAELRALQAQIEPHFLFNTLANAIALVDYEPQQAKRLLERFHDHLRATLAASRRTQTSLGDELQLLEGYLALMHVRMGQRLTYAFEVPEALRSLRFAPLLLQPLVENAITHGLEPKVEGGHIAVRAVQAGSRVRVTVADNGLGDAAPISKSTGLGLANVRERLQALWGDSARLQVQRDARGCAVELEFEVS